MTKELGEPISVDSILDVCEDKETLRALIVSMHLVECVQLPTIKERQAIAQALTML